MAAATNTPSVAAWSNRAAFTRGSEGFSLKSGSPGGSGQSHASSGGCQERQLLPPLASGGAGLPLRGPLARIPASTFAPPSHIVEVVQRRSWAPPPCLAPC